MNHNDFILPAVKINNGVLGNSGVYFMQGAEGYIKIGKTGNVFKRRSNYRTHNSTIRVVGWIWIPEKYMDEVEVKLHQLWDDFRVTGEWFAPVPPLVEYISHFWKGHGLTFTDMILDGTIKSIEDIKTYQDLLRIQCARFYETKSALDAMSEEEKAKLRTEGWEL